MYCVYYIALFSNFPILHIIFCDDFFFYFLLWHNQFLRTDKQNSSLRKDHYRVKKNLALSKNPVLKVQSNLLDILSGSLRNCKDQEILNSPLSKIWAHFNLNVVSNMHSVSFQVKIVFSLSFYLIKVSCDYPQRMPKLIISLSFRKCKNNFLF